MSLTPRQQEIKARFTAERGFWGDFWDVALELDEELLDGYTTLSGVPWSKGHLPPKLKELLYLAMDASTTHLYGMGARVHMRNARQYGASREEVIEVLELVSELGFHTMTVGVPIVLEEAARAGVDLLPRRRVAADKVRDAFVALHGYWDDAVASVLEATPEFLAAYVAYSAVPRSGARLSAVDRELVFLAVSAAVTHLHPPAVRLHARNALAAGASVEQLVEVLEIVAVAGVHTITDGFPMVAEVFFDT